MSVGMQTVHLIPIAVGLIGLLAGVYVYRRNPYVPPAKAFLIVMMLFAAYGPMDLLFRIQDDAASALLIGRISLFMLVLAFCGMLYLSSFLPYERFAGWFTTRHKEFALISLLAAFLGAYAPRDVTLYDYGWGFPITEGFVVWMCVMVGIGLAAIYMMTDTCLGSKDKAVRRQATLLSLGVASPYVYVLVVSILLVEGFDVPNTYSPGLIFLVAIFAYAILRYRYFNVDVKPQRESPLHTDNRSVGEVKGRLVLVEDKKTEGAHEIFRSLASPANPALLVTRMIPGMDEEGMREAGITVLTLSGQVGENRLDPTNLSILSHTVREFLKKSPTAAVMIDGLEYLFSNNQPDKVVRFVQSLRDEVIMTGATLLIPLDPETIEERYRSMFERDFEIVWSGEGAGTEI
ncbi:MAG TPA: DUF835 domain-containing protein [Methanomassiliicoccales archaeon]|nr:DUF835 domain-containing protein [Methanomassiliicoccales archaeon]